VLIPPSLTLFGSICFRLDSVLMRFCTAHSTQVRVGIAVVFLISLNLTTTTSLSFQRSSTRGVLHSLTRRSGESVSTPSCPMRGVQSVLCERVRGIADKFPVIQPRIGPRYPRTETVQTLLSSACASKLTWLELGRIRSAEDAITLSTTTQPCDV